MLGHMVSEGFPDGSVVKKGPAVQETRVPPLGQEDPLEEGMATHPSTIAWRWQVVWSKNVVLFPGIGIKTPPPQFHLTH